MAIKSSEVNLTKSLAELGEIVTWFENQNNVDVEVGLEKVRAAAKLITASKTRLTEIENEFRELEKEIGGSAAVGE
jgi:Asp-tRNA(Asn)/Glu-tRNA(Gln) amidotransferase C subunit